MTATSTRALLWDLMPSSTGPTGRDAVADPMREALEIQAFACGQLGSLMYQGLFTELANDYEKRGPIYALLAGRSERPIHDAIPLRLAGALHKIVLEGRAPQLARHYPSVGGTPSDNLLTDFIRAINDYPDEVEHGLNSQVQTNEVGRSVVHLVLSHWLSQFGISQCDWLELGASAGLNLNFDRFYATCGELQMGDSSSTLRFDNDWFASTPQIPPTAVSINQRRGVDITPIDITKPSEESKLLSFVWPDQTARFQRLRAAVDIAKLFPPVVDAQSADVWLEQQLAATRDIPVVVFHSITWQYLGEDVQRSLRNTLHNYAQHASPSHPLVWARMEPAGAVADIQITLWRGSSPEEFRLAEIGYHGQNMAWLS